MQQNDSLIRGQHLCRLDVGGGVEDLQGVDRSVRGLGEEEHAGELGQRGDIRDPIGDPR